MGNKAIFLDRDGTLNYDYSYVYKLKELKILDGVKEGLENLKSLGYLLILVTNQSGIGRGYYTIDDCKRFNDELQKQLGLKFDGIYICPHTKEDNCKCRKPNTLMIENAVKDFKLDIKNCFFIGDKESDIQCGINAGCKTVLIENNQYDCKIKTDYKVKNISDLSKIIK